MRPPSLPHFLRLLDKLIRQPAVIGAETPFFNCLEKELKRRGAKVARYEGLLVAEGSDPDSVQLSAHVDRHGLMKTGPQEFQYAAFVTRNKGDLNGDSISEQTFEKIVSRFHGEPVHAYDPWSGKSLVKEAAITNSTLCSMRNVILFELDTKAGNSLPPGVPIAFKDRLNVTKNHIQGQLDNALGVAALVYLFELGFQGRCFFTGEEEAGRSWRYLANWLRIQDPKNRPNDNPLWVIDTSPFSNSAEADAYQIVLRNRDATSDFCAGCVQKLVELCERRGDSFVFKDEYIERKNKAKIEACEKPSSLGQTELGRLIAAIPELSGATIQVPTTGYHTRHETASVQSVTAFLGLLFDLVSNPKIVRAS